MIDLFSKDFFVSMLAPLTVGILIIPTIRKVFKYLWEKRTTVKKSTKISGVYDCEYHIHWKPEGKDIIYERIYLIKVFDKYYGFLLNNYDDENFRKVKRPTPRLKGELFVERYFIGYWSHPLPDNKTYGAFNLTIDLSGKIHKGLWNGDSDTYNTILSGRWVWKKKQIQYPFLIFILQLAKL